MTPTRAQAAGERDARRKPAFAARHARVRLDIAVRRQGEAQYARGVAVALSFATEYAQGVASTLTSQGRCLRCGRGLTDPESIARQIGPDCLAQVGGDTGWELYRQAIGLDLTGRGVGDVAVTGSAPLQRDPVRPSQGGPA